MKEDMSTESTTETSLTTSGKTPHKEHTSSSPERRTSNSPSDGKDLLHSLKGQVSFAKQCLGLLQNQMKHAMDTLEILQDQVIKAQTTIDRIERKENKQICTQKSKPALVPDSLNETTPGTQGHHMVIVDGNGQPLYAIDKPGTSYGIPIQHQSGPCPCPSCTNVGLGHPVYISGNGSACTEQGQQLIALHSGQVVYQVDGKQTTSSSPTSQEYNDASDEPRSGATSDIYCSKKRKCSCSSYSDTSPKAHGYAEEPRSPPQHQAATESSQATKTLGDSKSTSPIATQLLQVIDVLQNAGDDDSKDVHRDTRLFTRCGYTQSSEMPFTGPVPRPVYTTSGSGILGATSRRCRKQDINTVKVEDQDRQQEMARYSASCHDTERELPDLMKVPPPVLAGTLEPDFLVVPGNSYFADSPPSAGTAGSRNKEKSASKEGEKSTQGYDTTFPDVKKERYDKLEPIRSSSASSMSQASEGSSRSPSESSNSEKCVSKSLETHNNDKEASIIFSANNLRPHPDGDFGDSHPISVTTDERSSPVHLSSAKTSLLNSLVSDKNVIPSSQVSQVSPKIASTRGLKMSPLNSVMSSPNEHHRTLDFPSNPGILRISHATPISTAIPCSLSIQKPETPSIATHAPFPNDVLTSSRNSFVHRSNSESELSLMTSYSVAQIANDHQKSSCTSPKRPNILSRNRQGKKDIPQGIVVLVPTIEDAKQLIKSSGGSQATTPVLVPQTVLNQYSANGEAPRNSSESHGLNSSRLGKRTYFEDNNVALSRPKRRPSEPLVID